MDTIAGIALKYSVTISDIKQANNIMSDYGIYAKNKLRIPNNPYW